MENDWKAHRCFKRCNDICGAGCINQIGEVTGDLLDSRIWKNWSRFESQPVSRQRSEKGILGRVDVLNEGPGVEERQMALQVSIP